MVMPHMPSLAPHGKQLAGYLGMDSQWDEIELTPGTQRDHVHELIKRWLNDTEEPAAPHTLKFFYDIMNKCTEEFVGERSFPDSGPKFAIITTTYLESTAALHFVSAPHLHPQASILSSLHQYTEDESLKDKIQIPSSKIAQYWHGYRVIEVNGIMGVFVDCSDGNRSVKVDDECPVVRSLLCFLKVVHENKCPLQVMFNIGCWDSEPVSDEKDHQDGTLLLATEIDILHKGKKVEPGAYVLSDKEWCHSFCQLKVKGTHSIQNSLFFMCRFPIHIQFVKSETKSIIQSCCSHHGVDEKVSNSHNTSTVCVLKAIADHRKHVGGPKRTVFFLKGICSGDVDSYKKTVFFSKETEEGVDYNTRIQMCTVMSLTLVLRAIAEKRDKLMKCAYCE
jgi:hypothetical protein